MEEFLAGYTAYAAPAELQEESLAGHRLGNVGTSLSISVSVSYSWSVSWSWSWT